MQSHITYNKILNTEDEGGGVRASIGGNMGGSASTFTSSWLQGFTCKYDENLHD